MAAHPEGGEQRMVGVGPDEPPKLQRYIGEWSGDLAPLWQNHPLDEHAFLRFAKDRGLAVSGVIKGEPGDFNRRGWLPADAVREDGETLFHPFRIYPLERILQCCRLPITASSSLKRDAMPGFVAQVLEERMPSVERIGTAASEWNRIADLAVLLDPLYWPRVTGRRSRSAFMSDDEYEVRLGEYRGKALRLVGTLDPEEWRRLHETLRVYAAQMDDNGALYLLLRLSKWSRREALKGRISGALWLRHTAEVIRRAFEEVHVQAWAEEDQAFGYWRPGGVPCPTVPSVH